MVVFTVRNESFHLGNIFVSCEIGWKRCNTFKTDRAQATQITRKGVIVLLKDLTNMEQLEVYNMFLIVTECWKK